MAIKENSKKLNLGKMKPKTKKLKNDFVVGKSAPEDPKNNKDYQDKIILNSEQSTKKNKNIIKIEPGNTPDIKQKKLKKIKKKDTNIAENRKIVPENDIKKAKKARKRKLSEQDSETKGESSELDSTENISKKSRKLKKKKSSQGKPNKVETNNEISEESDSEEIVKKPKKLRKRKLSETDIIDSDATDTEEILQKKKKKVEKEDKKESEDPDVKARTVFVGNVPLKTTKKDIKKQFRKYGIIESVRIRGIPAANPKLTKRVAAIKQEFHPERNNFLCYIRYKNKEDAQKAEAENGVLFQGHHLRVHCCESTAKPDETKAIFVGNLSFNATEDELWKLFEICGPISHVRIIRDTFTGMGKGFAYVNFKDSDAVQLALEMEDVKLRDRELRISLCNSSVAKKNKKMNKRKEITRPGQPHFKKPFKNNRKQKDDDSQNDREFIKQKKKGEFTPKGKKSFQGSKFNEKKKKFKKNKEGSEKKKKINMIAPKTE